MTSGVHKVLVGISVVIIIASVVILVIGGYDFYTTRMEERFYHPDYDVLKPSGITGHGLGIMGSLSMLAGVSLYMMRKRMSALSRMGRLKYWLEFHMFLCILGPILVLFHTSFKFGGLVSISFWSMVAVFLSGVIGRFIYLQIPRSIEGRELSLNEIEATKGDLSTVLKTEYSLTQDLVDIVLRSAKPKLSDETSEQARSYHLKPPDRRPHIKHLKKTLKKNSFTRNQQSHIIKMVKNEARINRKIERLHTMQELFRYWHVAHLPFAMLMLLIMIIHVFVTVVFGYRWIFGP